MSGAWISDGSVQALKIVNFVGGMSANGPSLTKHSTLAMSGTRLKAEVAMLLDFDLIGAPIG